MADQKRWFKVWSTILFDPHHSNMPLEDVGRWTRLGALIVSSGENGRIEIFPPARQFLASMECQDFESLFGALRRLPNVYIERRHEEGKGDNGRFTVIMKNWSKYQCDSTVYERVKRLRSKRRGEEKRREEEENTTPQRPPLPDFLNLWNTNCGPLPKADKLTSKRRMAAAKRWRENPDESYWTAVIKRLAASSFCRGEVERQNGEKPWVATIDWLLANDTNHVKVTEGKYDDKKSDSAFSRLR